MGDFGCVSSSVPSTQRDLQFGAAKNVNERQPDRSFLIRNSASRPINGRAPRHVLSLSAKPSLPPQIYGVQQPEPIQVFASIEVSTILARSELYSAS